MRNEIPQRIAGPLNQSTLRSRQDLIRPAYTTQTVANVNCRTASKPQTSLPVQQPHPVQPAHPVPQPAAAPQPVQSAPAAPVMQDMAIPQLPGLLKKGQKAALEAGLRSLTFGFGWNVSDSRCDIDASAFLVTETGKVPGDDWFVFYGQDVSPDGSVRFSEDSTHTDRERITVDLTRLDPRIRKVIFVLTINEAFEQHLNFSMIRDPYVRMMDPAGRVLLSYRMEELYANVTSMTIGELYLHNGAWKFNPVGNGVQQDLAGQCAIYGVEIA